MRKFRPEAFARFAQVGKRAGPEEAPTRESLLERARKLEHDSYSTREMRALMTGQFDCPEADDLYQQALELYRKAQDMEPRGASLSRRATPIAGPGAEDPSLWEGEELAQPMQNSKDQYMSRWRPFTDQERATLKEWGFRQVPEDRETTQHENWVMQNPHVSIITNRKSRCIHVPMATHGALRTSRRP
jgi:hypothetical protein